MDILLKMNTEWSNSVNCEACSIQYAGPSSREQTQNERVPLLLVTTRKSSMCTKVWAAFLLMFLCVGVAIGSYLLIKEDDFNLTSTLSIISRDSWNAVCPNNKTMVKLKHPIRKIRMIQLNNSVCNTEVDCYEQLLNIQVEHIHVLNQPDIMYNFLVAADGQVYEGRGWNYVCDYNDTLTIAVFGTGNEIPNSLQMEGLRSLLELAIYKKMLIPCYEILVKYEPHLDYGHFIVSIFSLQDENKRLRNCI